MAATTVKLDLLRTSLADEVGTARTPVGIFAVHRNDNHGCTSFDQPAMTKTRSAQTMAATPPYWCKRCSSRRFKQEFLQNRAQKLKMG